ncbi:MAG TPA: ELWxxDGT repeat protein, partial [Candidatus Synoicihabitans sp.]|nr:ELWxxDGT repeat protein [Candidatus Synoicihabitans sp.]
LFIHDDGIHGRELWATDGTAAGTRLVRDINPGPADGEVDSLTPLNGVAYFWANDGTNGLELWRSDGTAEGTAIVANIGPGSTGFGGFIVSGHPLPTLNGLLYFTANDGTTGIEPWRSDGTAAGTYRLMDIEPGASDSEPMNFLKLGSRLFFNATSAGAMTLWSTDGTVGGTRRVGLDPANASNLSTYNAVVVGETAFIGGMDPEHGAELWRLYADGTASMVADLNTFRAPDGTNFSSGPRSIVPAGNGVLFVGDIHVQVGARVELRTSIYWAGVSGSAITKFFDWQQYRYLGLLATIGGRSLFYTDGDSYSEIWSTDGTLAGTARVRPSGQALLRALGDSGLVHGDGEVFFYARNGDYTGAPTTIWRSDGTPEGTREYYAPAPSFFANDLVRLNGRLYFPNGRNTDQDAGGELWTTDGTPAGTHRVTDIFPGPDSSDPDDLSVVLGKLFFSAKDGVHGREPWMSDGTAAGTVALGDLSQPLRTGDGAPHLFTRLGEGMLFLANDGISGLELWYSNGSSAGTQPVKEIVPGQTGLALSKFEPLGDFVLFRADDGTNGSELWRSDGTTAGTYRVADIAAGAGSSDPEFHSLTTQVLNGVAYFSADDGMHGRELWRSDGTAAGTYMVIELTPGNGNSHVTPLGVANGKLIFRHQDIDNGKLWATDGTPAGTTMINAEVYSYQGGVTFGNALYFAGQSGMNETYADHLWRSDGTIAGTQRVAVPDAATFAAHRMQVIREGLLVEGCSGATCGLYVTDGTPEGMRKLTDTRVSSPFLGDDSQLFFLNSVGNQPQIYRTDGTVAGTGPLLPGFDFGGPVLALGSWFHGWLFFTVNEAGRGPVIWRTNGTATGTRRFADLDSGTDPNNRPYDHFVLGDRLLFSGFRPDVGYELFAISADAPNAEDDIAQAAFNTVVTT